MPVCLQFFELLDCTIMADLESFVASGGRAELKLVQLLLEHGADPDAAAGERSGDPTVSGLQGLRPLHILSWWIGGECRCCCPATCMLSTAAHRVHACASLCISIPPCAMA